MLTPGVDDVSTATADVMPFDALRHGFTKVAVNRIASPGSILPLLLPRLSFTATLCTSMCGNRNDSLMPVYAAKPKTPDCASGAIAP